MASPELPLVTVSRMKTFRRCAREDLYKYEFGYRAATEAEALRFGTLMHLGLETWFKSGADLEQTIEAMRAGVAADEYELVRAEELMRGYHFRWCDEPMTVLAVEQQFRADLRNPETGGKSRTFDLGGKVDAVVQREDGVYIVEHKTTSEDIGLGSPYWERLRIDAQVSVYFAGAKSLGYDVVGCIYDVIRKPTIRPKQVPLVDEDGVKIVLDKSGARVRTKDGKKFRESADAALGYELQSRAETADEYRTRLRADIAENPDRYYQRGTVVRLEEEERDAAFDNWQTAELIREANRRGRHLRNTDSCMRFSRACEFFQVCTGAASLEDESRFRRTEHVHEELSA